MSSVGANGLSATDSAGKSESIEIDKGVVGLDFLMELVHNKKR